MTKKLNIILDLDNTLVYTVDINKKKYKNSFKYTELPDEYIIFWRPGLEKFLDWLFENFHVSVWSAGSKEYVDFIVNKILEKNGRRVDYVLNSDNCEVSQEYFGHDKIKDLKLLWDVYDLQGFGPYNTLIIDDLYKNIKNNTHNSLRIKKFVTSDSSRHDREFDKIKKELVRIHKHYVKDINHSNFKLV